MKPERRFGCLWIGRMILFNLRLSKIFIIRREEYRGKFSLYTFTSFVYYFSALELSYGNEAEAEFVIYS